MKFAKTGKGMLTIILLCLVVSSSLELEAAQETQATTTTGQVTNSPTKPQQQRYGIGYPASNQNQPILGQPSSSSPVNQPLTGFNQPSSTGLNQPILGQPSSTGLNQPSIGQPSSSSSVNQPLTGLNQPITGVNQPLNGFNQPSSTGFNQPISSSSSSSSSALNQPFSNRLNQNSLSGVPFINGNPKMNVPGTKIIFIWIAIFLGLHGTDRN